MASFVCVPGARADDISSASTPTSAFAYNADAGIGYSDNIGQIASPRVSEEIASVGVQFTGVKDTSHLQASAAGDLQYLDFVHQTFSPEVVGNFSGMAAFTVIPEHFRWTLQDNFGQGLIDPFVSATPGNRENINSVATGPTVMFALGEQMLLSLTGGYERVTYQVSPLDNNEFSGGISLARLLSRFSRLSLNVQSTRYDFQDPINPDYDQRQAYVRYDVVGARTKLSVDVGYEQVEGQQMSSGGVLTRLNITRTLAPLSFLTLTAGREDSNSGAFLTQMQNVTGIGLGVTPGQQSSAPFTNTYLTGGWSFTRRRTTFNISASRFKQAYPDQASLDQTLTGADVRLSRILAPTWSAAVYANYSKQIFAQQLNENFTELRGGAEVRWQLGRLLALRLQYEHQKRNSDQALYTFSENRVFLRVVFGDASALQAVRMNPTTANPNNLNPNMPFVPQLQRP